MPPCPITSSVHLVALTLWWNSILQRICSSPTLPGHRATPLRLQRHSCTSGFLSQWEGAEGLNVIYVWCQFIWIPAGMRWHSNTGHSAIAEVAKMNSKNEHFLPPKLNSIHFLWNDADGCSDPPVTRILGVTTSSRSASPGRLQPVCVRRLSSVHPGTAGNQTGAQQQVSVSWVENHKAEQVGDKCVCRWGVCSTASRNAWQRYYCNISVCYYCLFCLIIH